MDLILPIVLGALVLASFVIAYMSSKTWQVYQAVLVVFIFLGTVAFFILGARTLATHKSWGELVGNMEREIQTNEQQTLELRGRDQNAQGQNVPGVIPQLKQTLEILVSNRGGVMYDVAVDNVKDGVAQLTLKAPEHGLVPNSVLFAFDGTPAAESGRYLGEFKVVTAAEGNPSVQITPNLPLTESQSQRLAAAKGPLTLYATMPIDNPALFAELDDPTRQTLLPKDSLVEYANRERKLRDYQLFFHDNYVQTSLITDAISKLNSNIERTNAAAEETRREIAYRESEKTSLAADLEKFRLEVQAIATYQKSLENLFAKVRQSLKSTYAENRRLNTALTVAQLKAAEAINARTDLPSVATP